MSIGEDRIEQHIFRFIEKELYSYTIAKKLITDWELERNEIAGETPSTLGHDSDRFSQNKISNPTTAKAMRLMQMAGKVDRAKWFSRAIDDVLETLGTEDKLLVELKYFKALLTNAGVARELNMSPSTFYERREKLIEKFGLRMGLL